MPTLTRNELRLKFRHWFVSEPTVLDDLCDFFARPEIIQRLEDAEIHFGRPPIAGVARELEGLFRPDVAWIHLVGHMVRAVLEARGWTVANPRVSSVGTVAWVKRGQRFQPPERHPKYPIWLAHEK